MTKELIGAYTKLDAEYPGYVNASAEGDTVTFTVRGDPDVYENAGFICGYARDRGLPGRCTPGDENCNNYCNLAPKKGRMQDHPKPCRRVVEGKTVTLSMSKTEWAALIASIGG